MIEIKQKLKNDYVILKDLEKAREFQKNNEIIKRNYSIAY